MPPKKRTHSSETPVSSKKTRRNTKIEKEDDSSSDAEDTIPPYIPVFIYERPLQTRSQKQIKEEELKERILKSNLAPPVKNDVLVRLQHIEGDKQKQIEWFENLLRIPFRVYSKLPVSTKSAPRALEQYFTDATKILDTSVYGMNTVKEEVLNYIAQFISQSNSHPRILGLKGSAGVGKTEICTSGLSKALDRPIKYISCGGIRDSSHFLGFDWTYSGSRFGCITQMLMESQVMNPILFFDELDKISQSHDGVDVQNLLIHLTDPVQNMNFQDKYFSGIPIDLSKVVFIFSFNDESLIHPVLKDRIHIIHVPDPAVEEKIVIAQHFLKKQLAKNVGLKETDIAFSNEVIRHIIKNYCKGDKGVRGLKRCIETIFLKINTSRYLGSSQRYKCLKEMKFPFCIETTQVVDELIKENHGQNDNEWLSHMYL